MVTRLEAERNRRSAALCHCSVLACVAVDTTPERPSLTSALDSLNLTPENVAELFATLDDAWDWALADPDDGRPVDDTETPGRRRLRRGASRVRKILGGAGVMVLKISFLAALLQKDGPANWHGLASYNTALTLMKDGFPAVWVPDTETLLALAKAPDRPTRQALLMARRPTVLAHARRVLAEVTAPDLLDARAVVAEALDGLTTAPRGAQTLALNAATVVALTETGKQRFFELSRDLEERTTRLHRNEDLSLISDLKKSLLLLTVAPALETFRPWRGDPVPTRPNRHGVAHSVSPLQFTEANALESVLLAVSVLRQAQAAREDRPPTGATARPSAAIAGP